jgi:hypothetical protein
MKYEACIATILCTLVVGCASVPKNQAVVTFYSQPPGAMLYEGDVAWGLAPQTRVYTGSVGQPHLTSKAVTAVWASGARDSRHITMTLGQRQEYMFSRPQDAPGLDTDLGFVNQLQRNAIAKQQADAASAEAARQALQSMQPKPKPVRAPTTTNCTALGDTIKCTTW